MSDHESRTPVSLSSISENHPNLQPKAKYPAKVEARIAVLLTLGFLGLVGFGVAFWVNAAPWTLGLSLGGSMLVIGVGVVAWGKYLMPRGPFVEERHELRAEDSEREAFAAAIVERGAPVVQRRSLLFKLFGAGQLAFGVVGGALILRGLGPNPGNTLDRTNWKRGSYLVGIDGRRVHEDQMSIGGISTVFPEGYENDPDSQSQDQVVLIRVADHSFTTMKGRSDWAPRGYVAYSKLCTHLGCPVGLYQKERELLVCPCHQSMFNVRNGAVPQFGPAPRPLPQLPLMIDRHGYLRARGTFHEAVGPGFWERS